MKIAYISLHWPRSLHSGVGNKMDQQIKAWRHAGHPVRLFMHTHAVPDPKTLLNGEIFSFNPNNGLLFREIGRVRALQHLLRSVESYQPDLIYLRSGMYVFQLEQLHKIAPLCVEINTNDLIEHRRLGKTISFYNQLTRALTLKSASAFVFESGTLVDDPGFSQFHKPSAIIGNGIDLSRIDPLPAPNNRVPQLVFIGTPGLPWHGIDKLEILANRLPDINIDVIGYDSLPNGHPPPKNLRFQGYLAQESKREILKKADAAISSMALHRIQKLDGTPLKTLEYLAHGIPVILPYRDTNLQGLETDFLLRIPDEENNIAGHAEKIHQFLWQMRGKRVARVVIAPYIDSRIKEKQRLEFFEKITQNQKPVPATRAKL